MLADPLQDIDQVVIGIDIVEAASGQQALHDADLFGTQFRPAEQPSLPAHGDHPQASFQMICVDGYIGIAQEDLQPRPAFVGIGQCFAQWIAGQQS